MTDRLCRRAVLATTGALTAGSLGGCLATDGDDDETDDGGTRDDTADAGDDSEAENDGEGLIEYDEDAAVSFLEPEDGSTAAGWVYVEMEADGLDVAPAADGVVDGAGHFHVLVDAEPLEEGATIPTDDQHLHFGDGSAEAVIELEPGEHDLILQPGDGQHRALGITDEVTVEVAEASIEITSPADGDAVTSPVSVDIETAGLEIEEAGRNRQSAGHLHVLVNEEPVAVGDAIPSEDGYLHLGDGSASTELELEPGEYDVVAQVGTGSHLATPVTDEVSITVEE